MNLYVWSDQSILTNPDLVIVQKHTFGVDEGVFT